MFQWSPLSCRSGDQRNTRGKLFEKLKVEKCLKTNKKILWKTQKKEKYAKDIP